MSDKPIGVGIIGAGNISDTHARAAAAIPGVEIVAVYGQNAAKAARLAAAYGGRAYDRLEAFLDHRPMDLVAIGSPSALHADQGIAAAERGLHVLTEKPLDVTTARADALIEAADRHGVRLGVFFQDRLKPDVVRMKQLIDGGAIGRPILASGRVKWYRPPEYYSGSKWRGVRSLDGGGALINQAIHTLDLLLHLAGPIASVDARAGTELHKIEVEDVLVATLHFASGALGVFEASTAVYPGYPRRVEVTGTNGTLVLEHDSLVAVDLLKAVGSDLASIVRDVGLENRDASPAQNAASPVVSDATPHRRILEDFIHAIRARQSPVCDGREGRRSVAVVEAIYESARRKSAVTIPGGPS
ncbi:MAG TPA: Gfo/Idh/MocA family oxidoreductase [Vicinamibacterales bacterium]|jgi:predicted dehydrogenase